MISGLLLLPPSSVHAESGMHQAGQASHHSVDALPGVVVEELSHGMAASPMQKDATDNLEGEPCCGGICLTAALCAQPGQSVTSAQTTRYSPILKISVSADPRGHLRPPRA